MALTERLAVLIDAVGGGAVVSEFNKISKAAQKAHDDVAKGSTSSQAATSKLGKSLESLGITAKSALIAGVAAGATYAAAKIVGFARDSIGEFAAFGGEVRRLKSLTGATAEDASRLAVAFRTLGVDTDRGGNAMLRFSKNIEVNGTKLQSMGVGIARTKDGSLKVIPTLVNLADAFQRTTDQGKRAELVTTAFGARVGADLVPALARGKAGLEELLASADRFGLVMNDKDLEAARQFTIATRHMGEAVEGLKVSTGRGLAGAATGLVDFGTNIVSGLGFMQRGLSSVAREIPFVSELGHALHGVAAGAQAAGAALAGPLANLPQLFQSALSSQQGSVQLLLSEKTAALGVESAKHNLATAEQNLTAAKRSGILSSSESIAKARELRDADNSLADAQRSVTDAQKKLDDAMKGPSQHDLTQAAFDQREAQLSVADAYRSYQDALSAVEPDQLAIQHATLQLDEAQQRLADSNNEVSDLQQRNAADVANAQRDLKSAQDRLIDAEDRRRESMQKTVAVSGDVIGATLAVKQAHLDLVSAEAKARDTSDQLQTSLALLDDIDASNIKGQLFDVLNLLTTNGYSAQDFLDKLRAIEAIGASHQRGATQMEGGVVPGVNPRSPKPIGGIDNTFGTDLPFAGNFDSGGRVGLPMGSPGWAIVHGGETVTPRGAGGDVYINVEGSVISEGDLVKKVRKELLLIGQRNGTTGL